MLTRIVHQIWRRLPDEAPIEDPEREEDLF
jgi:hypothetical protein